MSQLNFSAGIRVVKFLDVGLIDVRWSVMLVLVGNVRRYESGAVIAGNQKSSKFLVERKVCD